MIKYILRQFKNTNSSVNNKWLAYPVIDETIGLDELSEHMSKHNTPFSPGTITGILTDAIACAKELALDGKRITLDGLVSIGLSITHKMGAATADEFSVTKNVDKVKLVAMGVGEFSSSLLTTQAKLKESNTYQSPRTGTTTTPTSPDDGGETPGGSDNPSDEELPPVLGGDENESGGGSGGSGNEEPDITVGD